MSESSPLPPPPDHLLRTPELQSVIIGTHTMPEGAPEEGSEDWLWYHPGRTRMGLSLTYFHICIRCDVAFLHKEYLAEGKKPRCWNCGRFCAKYFKHF